MTSKQDEPQSRMPSKEKTILKEHLEHISSDLDRTVKFWLRFSHDDRYGGFFNCLAEDGTVYDELKYGWLQGRQVWIYCKLYNTVNRFRKPEILDAARKGAEFLMAKVCTRKYGFPRCFFCVTRDGKGVKIQRTIFTECFYVMAMSQMYVTTRESRYKQEALTVMGKIVHWVTEDDTELGRPKLEGTEPVNQMAVPMMMLCLILEIEDLEKEMSIKYKDLADWCIKQLLAHVQRDGQVILENVSPQGKEFAGCQGRLTIPGHAIECGWFLLKLARIRNEESLKEIAIRDFILSPYQYGWDDVYGGLFYFLDADGLSPTQLEWDMKLWWPHNETLIAMLMAYVKTRDVSFLNKFTDVYKYCREHFIDAEHGEWFGYLNRKGERSMTFKGGPYKGCFHVIRCLIMCEEMLKELIE